MTPLVRTRSPNLHPWKTAAWPLFQLSAPTSFPPVPCSCRGCSLNTRRTMRRPFITNPKVVWRSHSPDDEWTNTELLSLKINAGNNKPCRWESEQPIDVEFFPPLSFLSLSPSLCSCLNISMSPCVKVFIWEASPEVLHKSQRACSGAKWAENHVWFHSLKIRQETS